MYLLKNRAVLKTDRKYRIAIAVSGSGSVNGTAAKKGDRIFIKDEKNISLNGTQDFEIVICE